ncbi:nicotinate-nucleotide--dimethylbenzimidazole phosphoribosyltransferase, partial [Streptomyces somaliensis]
AAEVPPPAAVADGAAPAGAPAGQTAEAPSPAATAPAEPAARTPAGQVAAPAAGEPSAEGAPEAGDAPAAAASDAGEPSAEDAPAGPAADASPAEGAPEAAVPHTGAPAGSSGDGDAPAVPVAATGAAEEAAPTEEATGSGAEAPAAPEAGQVPVAPGAGEAPAAPMTGEAPAEPASLPEEEAAPAQVPDAAGVPVGTPAEAVPAPVAAEEEAPAEAPAAEDGTSAGTPPTEAAPTEAAPTEAAPTEAAPTETAPTQAVQDEAAPADPAAVRTPAVGDAPVAAPDTHGAAPEVPAADTPEAAGAEEAAPAPDAPEASAPDGAAPAPVPPAEGTPAEDVPAEDTPAEAVPETPASGETAPTAVAPEVPTAVAPEVSNPDAPEAQAPAGPPAPGYADAEREAILRVMRERRDIRNGFRGDPIPHEVLLRVLEAAHTAPSVGHSQPWDFVVIRSAETRRAMHELAQRQREAYARSLPKARAKQFKELKVEAILDTPVNIVVTADPTRGGRHTLGRHTQPQMAPYSSALAVENLWLAARAEGLGVGWVSFFDEREMVRVLGLPEHLEVVAYLCVGYVDEFPEEPELMQAGWSKRRPLSWVVHEETYGRRVLPGEEPHDLLRETVAAIRPLDAKALGEAWERQKRMTKPAGALGMLEIISAQLCGLSRTCPPPVPEPAAVAVFAGDHGVHAQGVTAWPQEVTAQMVANFLGGGAVCNAFANQVGAEVCVVDVGVAADLPATPGLLPRKVRAGTADFTTGPALTRDEVLAAIGVGIETARDLVTAGNKAILTGEMGIANTTASAALISVYTGADPAEVTGRGTGVDDEMHARKIDVVRRALDLHRPDPADPIGVLGAVGGLEHAAMVGFVLGGASLRTPVVLDGVSAGAAALVARAIAPESIAACIAGHRSAEPGHTAALGRLGLRPLVDLDLRLGEGTGALLALPLVQSAARAMHEVATFDSAGVTEK